ncbi:hypothetical protein EGP91_03625 [bacterium]|nr:hypothetical protein [bacterium]
MLIYYVLRYVVVILLGYFIKFVGLPSIYDLSFLIYIPFNYIAISYGILNPVNKRKDVSYNKLIKPYIVITSLIAFLFVWLISKDVFNGLILVVINIIELLCIKPSFIKNNQIISQNINDYFKKHK